MALSERHFLCGAFIAIRLIKHAVNKRAYGQWAHSKYKQGA